MVENANEMNAKMIECAKPRCEIDEITLSLGGKKSNLILNALIKKMRK